MATMTGIYMLVRPLLGVVLEYTGHISNVQLQLPMSTRLYIMSARQTDYSIICRNTEYMYCIYIRDYMTIIQSQLQPQYLH